VTEVGTDLLPTDQMQPGTYAKRTAVRSFSVATALTVVSAVMFSPLLAFIASFSLWVLAIFAFAILISRQDAAFRHQNEDRARNWPFPLDRPVEDVPGHEGWTRVWFQPHQVNVPPVAHDVRSRQMYWNGIATRPSTVAFAEAKVDDKGNIIEYGEAAVFGGPGFDHLPLLDNQTRENQRDWVWQLPAAYRPPPA